MNEVTINDKAYPLIMSMGGLMYFAKLKGIKFNMIDDLNFSEFSIDDLALILFCLLKTSAWNQKVEFPYTVEDIEQAMFSNDYLIQAVFALFPKSDNAEKK